MKIENENVNIEANVTVEYKKLGDTSISKVKCEFDSYAMTSSYYMTAEDIIAGIEKCESADDTYECIMSFKPLKVAFCGAILKTHPHELSRIETAIRALQKQEKGIFGEVNRSETEWIEFISLYLQEYDLVDLDYGHRVYEMYLEKILELI